MQTTEGALESVSNDLSVFNDWMTTILLDLIPTPGLICHHETT